MIAYAGQDIHLALLDVYLEQVDPWNVVFPDEVRKSRELNVELTAVEAVVEKLFEQRLALIIKRQRLLGALLFPNERPDDPLVIVDIGVQTGQERELGVKGERSGAAVGE